MEKEEEADRFAVKWTLTIEEEEVITDAMNQSQLSVQMIAGFAKKFKTHPAVIIGRLQHKKLVPYNFGTEFLEPVELE